LLSCLLQTFYKRRGAEALFDHLAQKVPKEKEKEKAGITRSNLQH
jgi:hypothetical protein